MPNSSNTGSAQWMAYVPVGHRQVAQVIAAAVLSWLLLMGMAFEGGPASAHPYLIWRIYAGFAGAILTCAYVVHLRSRTAPFVLTSEEVAWLDRGVRRAHAPVRLLRWRHLIHDGTILEIGDPGAPLRVGVSHRLVSPLLISSLSLHGHVDAILSAPDFSDVVDALGVARLEWSPPTARGPMATWMTTIGIVSLLGFGIAFSGLGDRLERSIGGRAALMTVMFCMIAAGGILTFTRGERRAPTRSSYRPPAATRAPRATPHTTFWRTVGGAISVQVVSAAIGLGLYFLPIFVTGRVFAHLVDIPACRADCAKLELPFREYIGPTKASTGRCVCGDRTLKRDYTITGGTSIGASVLDWFVRAATFIVAIVAWPLIVVAPFIAWKRIRRSRIT